MTTIAELTAIGNCPLDCQPAGGPMRCPACGEKFRRGPFPLTDQEFYRVEGGRTFYYDQAARYREMAEFAPGMDIQALRHGYLLHE